MLTSEGLIKSESVCDDVPSVKQDIRVCNTDCPWTTARRRCEITLEEDLGTEISSLKPQLLDHICLQLDEIWSAVVVAMAVPVEPTETKTASHEFFCLCILTSHYSGVANAIVRRARRSACWIRPEPASIIATAVSSALDENIMESPHWWVAG